MVSTSMQWTTDKPTNPGWYWVWYDVNKDSDGMYPNGLIDMVKVDFWPDDNGIRILQFNTIDDGWWPVETMDYWIGPLPEPKAPIHAMDN